MQCIIMHNVFYSFSGRLLLLSFLEER